MVRNIRDEIVQYSAGIGDDSMLIQGAGGNISWKEGSELWIKASGTWLSEAIDKNIFVGLDRIEAKHLAEGGAENFTTAVIGNQTLRPSIETAFHALLPQTVVVHCHAVDVIAHTLIKNGRERLAQLLEGIDWVWIDYVKPGPDLAGEIQRQLKAHPTAPDVLVLAKHGLVVAGEDVATVDALLNDILLRTKIIVSEPLTETIQSQITAIWGEVGYHPSGCGLIRQFATNPAYLALAQEKWVLYPDHAVFLGGAAVVCDPEQPPGEFLHAFAQPPVCILVPGVDMMIAESATLGQRMMLKCYADVVCRLPDAKQITGLAPAEIAALLNWDAEKYRQQLNAARSA
jgi:rhamnose utilization protein RhaD (predicted bifunctional aldolase and dehydrogenase)